MNFQESIKYLYNLGYELSVKKFGLENTIKLLAALENPEKKFLKVQVAGTNGKGSTCAFLEAVCLDAGIKVGLFTSPHLISVTERIRINGAEISEADFARQASKIRDISENLVESGELKALPTFFEQLTAIALNAFREEKIDAAILETGIGGRFDATTATKAEILALTPIDFDHQNILGNSLSKIAAEKAAIIRAGTKAVFAKQRKEAQRVISDVCAKFGVAPISSQAVKSFVKGENNCAFLSHYSVMDACKISISFQTSKAKYDDVKLNLLGKHQIENAKVAILLAEILQETGLEIKAKNIKKGLQTAKHKGRLEFRDNFLFDGAHNVAGAKALRKFLDEFIKQPITMIFGSMEDKDIEEIARILFSKADKLIFTQPDNPRSMKTRDLMKFSNKSFDSEKIFETQTVDAALKLAGEISADKNLICVTGSLYLIGEAQKLLNNKSENINLRAGVKKI